MSSHMLTPTTLTVLRDSWAEHDGGCWHWSIDSWPNDSLDGTPKTLAEGHSKTKADAWVDGRLAATYLGLVIEGGDETSGYALVPALRACIERNLEHAP